MLRTFLVLGALFGLVGVAAGAFGSHALRRRLDAERLATFEVGVRYQLWHALALFAAAAVGSVRFVDADRSETQLVVPAGGMEWPAALAGWLFVAGMVLFSGSLYALALTGKRRWGMVAPLGGTCFLVGWVSLAVSAATA